METHMQKRRLAVFSFCLLTLSAASAYRMHMGHQKEHDDDPAAIKVQDHQLHEKWEHFKRDHGKSYADEAEEAKRKGIFSENLKTIVEHNELYSKGQSTYMLGVNQFTDLTFSEFKKLTACGNFSLENVPYPKPENFHLPWDDDSRPAPVPKAVDWRSREAVTPVKNQGDCGSCWAFSSTGALEGQHFIRKREYVVLSEQNLVDCSSSNGACNGGIMHRAFEDIKEQGGIDTEESYQYEGEKGTCRYTPKSKAATVYDYLMLPRGDEEVLKKAVAFGGPVAVAIGTRGPNLQHYHSGIYQDRACVGNLQIDHAVLAVGYNTNRPGSDYWIIKNSWGASWGMDGYILWPRNSNNHCGIGTYGVLPLV